MSEDVSGQELAGFYAACDANHREFYSVVLREWSEAGLPRVWDDGDLCLAYRAVYRDRTLCLFRLVPARDLERPRIVIDIPHWRDSLGVEQSEEVMERLGNMAGLKCRRSRERFEVLEPGGAAGPEQHAVRDVIKGVGLRARDLAGP